MTRDEIFACWAPLEGRWSSWVKPVLFPFLEKTESSSEDLVIDDFTPPSIPLGDTAIVVNLPGVRSVAAGLALARKGWRPIPLFNALPGPGLELWETNYIPTAVDVHAILKALLSTTPKLAAFDLAPTAPPAFLLDACRLTKSRTPLDGCFDNRSISFPSDFPSAQTLRSFAIRRVLYVGESLNPEPDLTHTLAAWQNEGLAVDALLPGPELRIVPLKLRKPSWWKCFLTQMSAVFTLGKIGGGGYGRIIPKYSSS